jgi:hypothetical protein
MFSFFKRNKGKEEEVPVPDWASFFTKQEYNTFIKELGNYLHKKGMTFTIQNSQAIVDRELFGAKQLGLTNVAQVCKQSDQKYYKELISEHFESMARGKAFSEGLEKIEDDYEKIKQYIAVRLYPNHYMENIPKDMYIGKTFTDDIYAMLVFDMPDTISNIKPEQAEKWGKTFEDLFEVGVKNTKDNNPLEISTFSFDEFDIWFAQGEHFFVPNIVFELPHRPELLGEHGAIIGLPHRHAALIYPLNSMKVVKAINDLIPTIDGMYREGPGSLSSNLYWYKNGRFLNLPYSLDDNTLRFTPPAEFVELLNTLAVAG